MTSPEQLIAQMLADEPDDGDRTITSRYLDGNATTATRTNNAKATRKKSSASSGRQGLIGTQRGGSGGTGGQPTRILTSNGRRFFEGQDTGGNGSGSGRLQLPPVSELEIRADAVSVCTELTDPTSAVYASDILPHATYAASFDTGGSQRHFQRPSSQQSFERQETQRYGEDRAGSSSGPSSARKEHTVPPASAASRNKSLPSTTESWTEISDGGYDDPRDSGEPSAGKKVSTTAMENRKRKCRRCLYISFASVLFVVVAAGIVFAVWRQPIVAAAQGAIKHFGGGGGGGGSDAATGGAGASDGGGGADQGQGNEKGKDGNLRRRVRASV
jgi:hypothetical protein